MIQATEQATEQRNQPIAPKFLRLADVMDITSLGRASVWNLIKRGSFPKGINLGLRCTAWDSMAVNEWMKERINKSVKVGC